MATIGRNHAVVELKKLRFGGFPGMGSVAVCSFDEHCRCKRTGFLYLWTGCGAISPMTLHCGLSSSL